MQECHIFTTTKDADELSDGLHELGAAAVTWQDAGNQPLYEPKPDEELHWDEIKLVALFEEDTLSENILAFLETAQQNQTIHSYEFTKVADKDWVRASLDLFVPTQFGKRLWVCPTWHEPEDKEAVNLMFDPGLAFGTGSHPTTALCLEWIDSHIKGGEAIVDYGCGSGILAVAALLLGASHALCVDYDPQALLATKMNAEINHLAENRLHICLPENCIPYQADILFANIISKPLIELAPTFATLVKQNAKLVLSGILVEQEKEVIDAYSKWFTCIERKEKDGWIRLVMLFP